MGGKRKAGHSARLIEETAISNSRSIRSNALPPARFNATLLALKPNRGYKRTQKSKRPAPQCPQGHALGGKVAGTVLRGYGNSPNSRQCAANAVVVLMSAFALILTLFVFVAVSAWIDGGCVL
jgi:hypothetical protein